MNNMNNTTNYINVRKDSFALVQCTNDNYNRCFFDFAEKHQLTYVSDIYSYYKWYESRTGVHFSVTITPFDNDIYPVTVINDRKELRKKINHAKFWYTRKENNLFYHRKYDLFFMINIIENDDVEIMIIKNMESNKKTELLIIDDIEVKLTSDIEQKEYQKLLIEIIKTYRNYSNRNDNFIDKVAYIFIHSYFRDGDFFKKKHYQIRSFGEREEIIDFTFDQMVYDNCMVIAPNIFACNKHRKYWIIDYDLQEVFEFTYLSEFLEKKLEYKNKISSEEEDLKSRYEPNKIWSVSLIKKPNFWYEIIVLDDINIYHHYFVKYKISEDRLVLYFCLDHPLKMQLAKSYEKNKTEVYLDSCVFMYEDCFEKEQSIIYKIVAHLEQQQEQERKELKPVYCTIDYRDQKIELNTWYKVSEIENIFFFRYYIENDVFYIDFRQNKDELIKKFDYIEAVEKIYYSSNVEGNINLFNNLIIKRISEQ